MNAVWMMILILIIPWSGVVLLATLFRKNPIGQTRTLQMIPLVQLLLILNFFREGAIGAVDLQGVLPALNLTLSLQLDRFAYLFVLLTGFVWLITAWTSCSCLPGDEASLRYRILLLGTLGAVCGVFMAGDLITLFLFYEIMTILSFGLVVADGSAKAAGAGRTYLLFGILSGLLLLAGILVLQSQGSSLLMGEISTRTSLLAPLLLLFGFGIKAGILPFHGWMPETYGAAPVSGAALLSGVLSKVGVYGILRVVLWFPLPLIGTLLNIAGVTAMIWGGYAALRQTEPSHILAYSSISQIGFILMGIGSGILLGPASYYGFQGAVFHAFNHGLFKSGLFLTSGILIQSACRRGRELVLGAAGVFMLGMIGIPFFSGGASKILLHHAWSDILRIQGPLLLWPGEVFFVLIGALTAIYCYRLYQKLARKPDFNLFCVDLRLDDYWPILAGALVVIGMGLFPQVANRLLVGPAADSIMEAVLKPTTWSFYYAWQDFLVVVVILVVAYAMIRWIPWGTVDAQPTPLWVSGSTLYRPAMRLGWQLAVTAGYHLEENLQTVYDRTAHWGARFVLRGYTLEERLQQVYDDASRRGADFVSRAFFEDVDRWNLDTGIRVVSVIMAFLLIVFFARYFFL